MECVNALHQKKAEWDMPDLLDDEREEGSYSPEVPCPSYSLKRVTGFFECDPWEARILAFVVMAGFEGEEFTARNLKKRLELPLCDLERIDRFLNRLLRKGWIRIDRPGENSMTRRYETNGKLVDAVIQERKSALKGKRDRSFDAYLHDVVQLVQENAGMRSPIGILESRIRRVHQRSRHLPFVKWLDGMKLSMLEVGYVCHVLIRLLEGEDDIDANDVMNMTHAGSRLERYRFRQALISGRLPMVAEGLIKVDLRFNGRLVEMNATEKLVEQAEGPASKTEAVRSELKSLERVTPGEVVRKRLHFNGSLQQSLDEFARLLQEDRLREVLERLESKGMNSGVVALFHGGAGTGKTESVMQMAAETGREVLRVNLGEVRNKYVGESEKAVKNIFAEYRAQADTAERKPILLFNEADGVLGRRIRVTTSVDQMNNTMQNILLEEMERFQGLLVATTNLATNLDPAFERRFTFKFAFEKGDAELRGLLWQEHFPDLDAAAVRQLAGSYELSPAQIANLAKRHEISMLLSGQARTDLEHFMGLAEEESIKGATDSRAIGFRMR